MEMSGFAYARRNIFTRLSHVVGQSLNSKRFRDHMDTITSPAALTHLGTVEAPTRNMLFLGHRSETTLT